MSKNLFKILFCLVLQPFGLYANNPVSSTNNAKSELKTYITSLGDPFSYNEKNNVVTLTSMTNGNLQKFTNANCQISTEWAIVNLAKNVIQNNDFFTSFVNKMINAKASFSMVFSNNTGKSVHADIPSIRLKDVLLQSKENSTYLSIKSKKLIGDMSLPEPIEKGMTHIKNDLSWEKGFVFIYEVDPQEIGMSITSQQEFSQSMKNIHQYNLETLYNLIKTEYDSYAMNSLLVEINLPHTYRYELKGTKFVVEDKVAAEIRPMIEAAFSNWK